MVAVEHTPQKDGTVQIYLSIKDLWRSARHDWRDFQKIKNELVGQEQMGKFSAVSTRTCARRIWSSRWHSQAG